jgi:hypothetical protein
MSETQNHPKSFLPVPGCDKAKREGDLHEVMVCAHPTVPFRVLIGLKCICSSVNIPRSCLCPSFSHLVRCTTLFYFFFRKDARALSLLGKHSTTSAMPLAPLCLRQGLVTFLPRLASNLSASQVYNSLIHGP